MEKKDLIRDIVQWGILVLILVGILCISDVKVYANPTVNPMDDIIIEYQEEKEREIQAEREKIVRQMEGSSMEPDKEIEDLYDFRLLCGIIWAEARGESLEGKKAVGVVIMNRVLSDEFPDTIEEVIYQRGQFQPVIDGNLNKGLGLYDSGEMNLDVKAAAVYALSGETQINYINFTGILYFHSVSIPMNNRKAVIGNHSFK